MGKQIQRVLVLMMACLTVGKGSACALDEPVSGIFVSTEAILGHPNHFSVADVRWNEKTGNFEVALCLYPLDLEKALSQMSGQSVDLDLTSGLDELMKSYVAKNFSIQKVAPAGTEPLEKAASAEGELKEDPRNGDSALQAPVLKDQNPTTTEPSAARETETSNSINARNPSSTEAEKAVKTSSGLKDVKDGVDTKLRWIGFEDNVKEIWLYFELPGDTEPSTWEIQNRVLFELNDEQVNQIRLLNFKPVKSYSLKINQPKWQFTTRNSNERTMPGPRN
jgi:hypothetical protein